ncbi:unnamed protein product [Macrosiphum euphorbiae]|uniref:Uncharacterized protein n=1 Tax=Macrosiphum euphorbiae TaxID=13131 RepID=A0AAV0Y1K4_9HEMI|nr:unnamed protein product [Macrosiphum euphorbiae]
MSEPITITTNTANTVMSTTVAAEITTTATTAPAQVETVSVCVYDIKEINENGDDDDDATCYENDIRAESTESAPSARAVSGKTKTRGKKTKPTNNADGYIESKNNRRADSKKMFKLNLKPKNCLDDLVTVSTTQDAECDKTKKRAKSAVHKACLVLVDCIKFDPKKYNIYEIESSEMVLLHLMTGYSVEELTWSDVVRKINELKFEKNTSEIISKYFSKYAMYKLMVALRKLKRTKYLDRLARKRGHDGDAVWSTPSSVKNAVLDDTKTTGACSKQDLGYYTKSFKPMFVCKEIDCNVRLLKHFDVDSL